MRSSRKIGSVCHARVDNAHNARNDTLIYKTLGAAKNINVCAKRDKNRPIGKGYPTQGRTQIPYPGAEG